MTHIIKFTGQAEVPFAPDENKDYLFAGEFSELSRTKNQDTGDMTYKFAPLRLATFDEAGAKIRLKTKNSNSVRIRAAIFKAQQERTGYIDMDSEAYYDAFTNKLTFPENLQAVLDLLNL